MARECMRVGRRLRQDNEAEGAYLVALHVCCDFFRFFHVSTKVFRSRRRGIDGAHTGPPRDRVCVWGGGGLMMCVCVACGVETA